MRRFLEEASSCRDADGVREGRPARGRRAADGRRTRGGAPRARRAGRRAPRRRDPHPELRARPPGLRSVCAAAWASRGARPRRSPQGSAGSSPVAARRCPTRFRTTPRPRRFCAHPGARTRLDQELERQLQQLAAASEVRGPAARRATAGACSPGQRRCGDGGKVEVASQAAAASASARWWGRQSGRSHPGAARRGDGDARVLRARCGPQLLAEFHRAPEAPQNQAGERLHRAVVAIDEGPRTVKRNVCSKRSARGAGAGDCDRSARRPAHAAGCSTARAKSVKSGPPSRRAPVVTLGSASRAPLGIVTRAPEPARAALPPTFQIRETDRGGAASALSLADAVFREWCNAAAGTAADLRQEHRPDRGRAAVDEAVARAGGRRDALRKAR